MTVAAPQRRAAVGVDELRRAWQAVQQGRFRQGSPDLPGRAGSAARGRGDAGRVGPARTLLTAAPMWHPAEPVVAVLGCAGSTGPSAVALALATAAAGASRVVECVTESVSGLAAASTAELGRHPSGWLQGTRGAVLIERFGDLSGELSGGGRLPVPAPAAGTLTLTVLHVGWDPGHQLGAPSWLAEQLAGPGRVVVVTAPTVPAMRALESALAQLEHKDDDSTVVAVLGPPRGRWPRGVTHSMGARAGALDRAGRLVGIPESRRLAVRGLDSTPLPSPLLAGAAHALRLLDLAAPTTGRPATGSSTNGFSTSGLAASYSAISKGSAS